MAVGSVVDMYTRVVGPRVISPLTTADMTSHTTSTIKKPRSVSEVLKEFDVWRLLTGLSGDAVKQRLNAVVTAAEKEAATGELAKRKRRPLQPTPQQYYNG